MRSDVIGTVRARRELTAASLVGRLSDLLSIPNVPGDMAGLQANAVWIRDALRAAGARSATTALPGAPPVVVGLLDGAPGAKRIGVYAHYDGQPVDPQRWSSPPFSPTLRDRSGSVVTLQEGEAVDPELLLYARGSADDRAPIFSLIAAAEATARGTGASIVFCFEGQEEIGSPDFPEYLDLLRDRLAADVWLICDGPVHASGRPQVALGVRGFAEVEITVFGPANDLHSGHYGDLAPNPAFLLAELVASLRDELGRPLVAGFGEGTLDVDPSTAAVAAAVPPAAYEGFAPSGADPALAVLGPLLNVRGLSAGGVGAAARNVVPERATASIDLRLAAGQDPVAALEAIAGHVAGRGFRLVDGPPSAEERRAHRRLASVDGTPGYPGGRLSADDPAARLVIEAVRAASGVDPIVIPGFGGSVPLHHLEGLGAPVAILPIANPRNNQHGPDEHLRIGNLWYGIDLMAALLGTGA